MAAKHCHLRAQSTISSQIDCSAISSKLELHIFQKKLCQLSQFSKMAEFAKKNKCREFKENERYSVGFFAAISSYSFYSLDFPSFFQFFPHNFNYYYWIFSRQNVSKFFPSFFLVEFSIFLPFFYIYYLELNFSENFHQFLPYFFNFF